MTEHDDRELRDRFQALRREDASGVPPFGATLARARARGVGGGGHRWTGWLAVAAVAVVALAVARMLLSNRRHSALIDLAAVRWEAPTDFLLVLPGEDLLRAVPDLGRAPHFSWRTP